MSRKLKEGLCDEAGENGPGSRAFLFPVAGRMDMSPGGSCTRAEATELMTIWAWGMTALSRATHSMPSMPAMLMSISTTSGLSPGSPLRAVAALPYTLTH